MIQIIGTIFYLLTIGLFAWQIRRLEDRIDRLEELSGEIPQNHAKESPWNPLPDYKEPETKKKRLTADELAIRRDHERAKNQM